MIDLPQSEHILASRELLGCFFEFKLEEMQKVNLFQVETELERSMHSSFLFKPRMPENETASNTYLIQNLGKVSASHTVSTKQTICLTKPEKWAVKHRNG